MVNNFTEIIEVKINTTDCSIVEQLEMNKVIDEVSWTLERERELDSSLEMRKVNLRLSIFINVQVQFFLGHLYICMYLNYFILD